jgi:hypothetical protein
MVAPSLAGPPSGTAICTPGPAYEDFTDFEPDQMVATKRGYLGVTRYNGVVKAQEVLTGCAYGTSFPNIGTSSAGNNAHAHIAAGLNGFAMVWSDSMYTRTFGTNLCD